MTATTNDNSLPEVFTAYAHDYTTDDANVTLTYNGSIVNSGANLDLQTGVYTCPRSGLYAFHSTMTSPYGDDAILDLRESETIQRATITSSYDVSAQSGNMAVFWCGQGTAVELKTPVSYSFTLGGVDPLRVSTFTGFLIGRLAMRQSNPIKCRHFFSFQLKARRLASQHTL